MSVTVNLTWTAPITTASAGAPTSYTIYRDTVNVGSVDHSDTVDPSYNDVGLPDPVSGSPVTYEYSVSASNAAGEGSQSTVASISI